MQEYIIDNSEQYSDAWWDARKGIPTASQFGRITTPAGNKSKQWGKYIEELKAGTGSQFSTYYTERGAELEPIARGALSIFVGPILEVGFIKNDRLGIGCSPDGLIFGEIPGIGTGGVEIKCPKLETHRKYIADDILPKQYIPQVCGSLYLCGMYDYWVFCSYHPREPLFVKRIDRGSDVYIWYVRNFSAHVSEFCDLLSANA